MSKGHPVNIAGKEVELYALLGDDRLSAEARVVGSLVMLAGEDGLTYPDLEALVPDASRDKLRRAAQLLERTKWVTRSVGGHGRGDRFTYLASDNAESYVGFRLAILGHLKDRMPATAKLSADSVPASPKLSAPSSSSTEPPPPPLDARVREWVESRGTLEGCRGALLDYLTERVEPDRQLAYAQSVAGVIEGTDEHAWMARDGTHVREGRQQIVAGCLNELRQGDEIGKYFPGQPGDVRNLKSKIRYRVKAETDAKRDAKRERDRPAGPAGPSQAPGAPGAARGKSQGGGRRAGAQRVRVIGAARDDRDPDRDRAVS